MADHERQGSAVREYFPRCATCRFAKPREKRGHDGATLAVTPLTCDQIGEWSSTSPPPATKMVFMQLEGLSIDGYMVLDVAPTFGCVMHEAKPNDIPNTP